MCQTPAKLLTLKLDTVDGSALHQALAVGASEATAAIRTDFVSIFL